METGIRALNALLMIVAIVVALCPAAASGR
jgi:hypothetical protein